jgi:hypothetical protein
MATISELMEGKAPGTVRITKGSAPNGHSFTPYYRSRDCHGTHWWYGMRESGISDCFLDRGNDWSLYTEPKPKVVWVEWLASPVGMPGSSGGLYYWPRGHTPKSNPRWTYTPTGREVEVEGE